MDRHPHQGPSRPGTEHGTAGLDRADPDRAQVVEDGIGRRHAVGPRRARHRGHRPARGLVGQHGHRTAVQDPPRVAQPVVEHHPGHRSLAGLDREEFGGADGVHLRRRHGHHDGALELEDHRPGIEDGARHGGGGHGPAGSPLVDDVDGRDHRGAAAPDHVDPEPERADLAQLGHGDQQRRGHDPPGEHRQAAGEPTQRVEVGEQPAGTQPAPHTPGVVVDGSPPLDGRRLFAVGGDLPPLETEVVADVAPPVGLPDRLVADPSGPAHDPTPAKATVGTATTLATVIRRSPAPLSRSSTTAEHRPSLPASRTRADVTTGPTRPSAR